MPLDMAVFIRASAGTLDCSTSQSCHDGGAGVGITNTDVATKDVVSDLSDSGGEDDILREVKSLVNV